MEAGNDHYFWQSIELKHMTVHMDHLQQLTIEQEIHISKRLKVVAMIRGDNWNNWFTVV